MSYDTDHYTGIEIGVLVVALVGSLNWGLIALVDTNLIEDTLSLTGNVQTAVYVAIAAAGVVVLLDLLFDQDLLGSIGN